MVKADLSGANLQNSDAEADVSGANLSNTRGGLGGLLPRGYVVNSGYIERLK